MPTNDRGNPAGALPFYEVSGGTPVGYQQITALAAATGLTPPAGATIASIVASGAAVRYRDDGTPPTAAIGMPIAIGVMFNYGGSLASVQFIQQAASAVLDIMYYK